MIVILNEKEEKELISLSHEDKQIKDFILFKSQVLIRVNDDGKTFTVLKSPNDESGMTLLMSYLEDFIRGYL